jgi:hypothetical protein
LIGVYFSGLIGQKMQQGFPPFPEFTLLEEVPKAILDVDLYEAHVQYPTGFAAIVRDPKVLSLLPREEKLPVG